MLEGEKLEARAAAIESCGQVVAVRQCECCGESRPGSGTFREVKRTCGGRTCPYCSWVRATERVELLRYAAEEGMARVPGYEWQFITMNLQYDPDKGSEDMTPEGLRTRALMMAKVTRKLWAAGLRGEGTALLRCTEMSEYGLVHVHAIYYGPAVDKLWIEAEAKKHTRGRGVLATVKRIKGGEKGVATATRYAAKSVKNSAAGFDEDFLTGEKNRQLIHPQLAARWEVGAYNLRLTEAYGALRGLEVPRPDEKGGPHDDGDVACSCGAVGRYRTIYRGVHDFLIECHIKGKAGMEGGRWLPYWMRENVRRKRKRKRKRK